MMPDPDAAPLTRQSLLLRMKDAHDEEAWREFHRLYSPLLYNYARSRGLSHSDAEDVRADCYETVLRQMPGFDYDRSLGGFKAWLRTIVVRRVIDRLRKNRERPDDQGLLSGLEDQQESADEIWEREWRQQHLRFCMDSVRSQVNNQTWSIFDQLLQQTATVAELCETMNLTANHVYKARSRVLAMIRDRMHYLEAHAEGT